MAPRRARRRRTEPAVGIRGRRRQQRREGAEPRRLDIARQTADARRRFPRAVGGQRIERRHEALPVLGRGRLACFLQEIRGVRDQHVHRLLTRSRRGRGVDVGAAETLLLDEAHGVAGDEERREIGAVPPRELIDDPRRGVGLLERLDVLRRILALLRLHARGERVARRHELAERSLIQPIDLGVQIEQTRAGHERIVYSRLMPASPDRTPRRLLRLPREHLPFAHRRRA